MKALRFKAKLEPPGGVRVPFDVRAKFGRARPPVTVTIGRHTYRSTVSVYGGEYFIPVRRSNREAAGVELEQVIAVSLALDTQERVVKPPPDLAAALRADPIAQRAWKALAFTHQREHADAIAGAKKPETRARRIAKAIEMLRAKAETKKR